MKVRTGVSRRPSTASATKSADKSTRRLAEKSGRKEAILLAAEKLFAHHGYHAVTIRQIAAEAGVQTALVDYYYGQKHELFLAIFEHWRSTLDERRQQLAEACKGPPGAERLRRVVRAFVQPVLRLRTSSEGEYYAQLVARELIFRTPQAEQVLAEHFDPLALAFIPAMQSACPGSTRSAAAWAYQFALGALLHHISDSRVERLSLGKNKAADPAAAGLLIDFICTGVAAVLSPGPSRRVSPTFSTSTTRRST